MPAKIDRETQLEGFGHFFLDNNGKQITCFTNNCPYFSPYETDHTPGIEINLLATEEKLRQPKPATIINCTASTAGTRPVITRTNFGKFKCETPS